MEGQIESTKTTKASRARLTPEEMVEKNRRRQKEYRARTKKRDLMKKYDLTEEEVEEYIACEARMKELREKHKSKGGSDEGSQNGSEDGSVSDEEEDNGF